VLWGCRDSVAKQSNHAPDRQFAEKVAQFLNNCDQAQIQHAPENCAFDDVERRAPQSQLTFDVSSQLSAYVESSRSH
jgi:hypothetical protein